MNAKKILILLAMAAASSATFAQDIQGGSAEGKTRQQVINELNDARAQGLLKFSDADYPVVPAAASTLSRAQVVAGIQQARKDGTLFSDYDYDYPRALPLATASAAEKSRAEVKAGIVMARADGTLFAPDWDYPVTHAKAATPATHVATASHNTADGNS